jgi:hypothetical protein
MGIGWWCRSWLLKPGAMTRMLRTISLDRCIVLEGKTEFELDSGEKRTLRGSDTYFQRGTCHKFTNVTLDCGWAKSFAVSQEIKLVEVNGKVENAPIAFSHGGLSISDSDEQTTKRERDIVGLTWVMLCIAPESISPL